MEIWRNTAIGRFNVFSAEAAWFWSVKRALWGLNVCVYWQRLWCETLIYLAPFVGFSWQTGVRARFCNKQPLQLTHRFCVTQNARFRGWKKAKENSDHWNKSLSWQDRIKVTPNGPNIGCSLHECNRKYFIQMDNWGKPFLPLLVNPNHLAAGKVSNPLVPDPCEKHSRVSRAGVLFGLSDAVSDVIEVEEKNSCPHWQFGKRCVYPSHLGDCTCIYMKPRGKQCTPPVEKLHVYFMLIFFCFTRKKKIREAPFWVVSSMQVLILFVAQQNACRIRFCGHAIEPADSFRVFWAFSSHNEEWKKTSWQQWCTFLSFHGWMIGMVQTKPSDTELYTETQLDAKVLKLWEHRLRFSQLTNTDEIFLFFWRKQQQHYWAWKTLPILKTVTQRIKNKKQRVKWKQWQPNDGEEDLCFSLPDRDVNLSHSDTMGKTNSVILCTTNESA